MTTERVSEVERMREGLRMVRNVFFGGLITGTAFTLLVLYLAGAIPAGRLPTAALLDAQDPSRRGSPRLQQLTSGFSAGETPLVREAKKQTKALEDISESNRRIEEKLDDRFPVGFGSRFGMQALQ